MFTLQLQLGACFVSLQMPLLPLWPSFMSLPGAAPYLLECLSILFRFSFHLFLWYFFFFFQAEDGIRDADVTGVQTCALPISFEQCRAIYTNNLINLLVAVNKVDSRDASQYIWQGRPSASLLRFKNQPETKQQLYRDFSVSIQKMLMRSGNLNIQDELPKDLRCFGDYSFHANRAVLLWVWLRQKSSPENIWEDPETPARVYENQ